MWSNGVSTAWTSIRWPWNWPACPCGLKPSIPICPSPSSITRSRWAIPWSAAGWIGSKTTRSRLGNVKVVTDQKGERTQRIEEFLKGPRIGNKRSGDGRIKKEMREVIESRFSKQIELFPEQHVTTDQVVAEARKEYEKLHSLPIADPDERERFYREHVLASPALQRLKQAMDEWCAVWFWPADEESLRFVPTPFTFHKPSEKKDDLLKRLVADLKCFHWEIEFPDAFTPERRGFDAVLGNPPWETAQPNPQEYFSSYDPLYRTLGRLDSLRRANELFEAYPGLHDQWISHCGHFKAFSTWIANAHDPFGHDDETISLLGRAAGHLSKAWKTQRQKHVTLPSGHTPFRHQTGRVFTYKLFLELAYYLSQSSGRIGMIVPAGLYTDSWSLPLRELFLHTCSWEWLFCFENSKKIFDIHSSFKFAAVIIDRRQHDAALKAAFMVHDMSAWERADPPVVTFSTELILLFSPRSKSFPEIRTERDLDICRTIYSGSRRVGDPDNEPRISFALEYMMNTEAKHFPKIEQWLSRGFAPDGLGRWVGSTGDSALPLYEGVMVATFDPFYKGYEPPSDNHTARWVSLPSDSKQLQPHYLMSASVFEKRSGGLRQTKIAFRDIARSTDERSMIAAVIGPFPSGNTAATLTALDCGIDRHLLIASCLDSLSCDFAVRQRLGGIHLNWFIVEECPLPKVGRLPVLQRITFLAAQLICIHRCFAPEWLKLKSLYPELGEKEWKHWWAVTEADRLRLRVESDAYVPTSTAWNRMTSTGSCGTTRLTPRDSIGLTGNCHSLNV